MKKGFTVPLPEAGEKAYLDFSIAAMHELHDFYGDDYVNRLSVGIDARNIVTLRKALEVMMCEANIDPDAVIAKMTLAELGDRIGDALYLKIHGRTLAQLIGEEQ